MTASISTPLTSTQMQDAQNKANTLAGAGKKVVRDGQFSHPEQMAVFEIVGIYVA